MVYFTDTMNIDDKRIDDMRIEQEKYAQSQTMNNIIRPLFSKGILGFALLPIAACQPTRSISQNIILTGPPADPDAEFVENPVNTFTARDDSGRFFEQEDATANLTVIGKAGNDIITTGLGDDVIRGGAGNDDLTGGDGNDTIDGEDGNDVVIGNDGDDILIGGAGNDLLNGGLGVDTLDGGTGDDLLAFFDKASSIDDLFDGGEGEDIFEIAPLDITTIDILGINIADLAGIDISDFMQDMSIQVALADINVVNIEKIQLNIEGSELTVTAQDVIDVTDQDNRLVINGDLGTKVIGDMAEWTSNSVEVIDGKIFYTFSNGTADLLIQAQIIRQGFQTDEPDFNEDTPNHFTAKDDSGSFIGRQNSTDNLTIIGGAGDDRILTGAGADEIHGGAGKDQIKSGSGEDIIFGGDGNDDLSGQGGVDEIHGGAGIDKIFGGDEDDLLFGGDDGDLILGGFGNDTINGDDGNDILDGNFGDDILNGGAGNDLLTGDDPLIGGVIPGNDILNGGDGDDSLWGGNGDIIDGGAGFDTWVISSNTIDFSRVTVSNIEEISLAGNPLTIALQDVLDITDTNNELIISGSTEGTVTSTGQDWIQGEDQTIDGEIYHIYTSGDATLLVDVDLTQDIS